ncbi:MAG: hypothetical protein HN348_28750, partial [Proteobacteria bacterium]|nr:hypothetical protein [Pseudomonadota bacterium]
MWWMALVVLGACQSDGDKPDVDTNDTDIDDTDTDDTDHDHDHDDTDTDVTDTDICVPCTGDFDISSSADLAAIAHCETITGSQTIKDIDGPTNIDLPCLTASHSWDPPNTHPWFFSDPG